MSRLVVALCAVVVWGSPVRESDEAARVAVIGGGIAGGATSYYLQNFLKAAGLPPAAISVYERSDYVGGRLKSIEFEGVHVEIGGAAWVDANQYMVELAKEVLPPPSPPGPAPPGPPPPPQRQGIGVWNGSAFLPLVDIVVRHAGDLAKITALELEFIGQMKQSYAKQRSSPPWANVSAFLEWGGIDKYTNRSISSYLEGEWGISPAMVQDAAVPLNRAIYNRNADSAAFAFLASLTAEFGGDHHAPGGNGLLVKALLDKAGGTTTHLSTDVRAISLAPPREGTTGAAGAGAPSPRFSVLLNTSAAPVVYDHVVVAAPLERTAIRFTDLSDAAAAAKLDRGFTDWYVTVIKAGALDAKQFGPASAADPCTAHEGCIVLTTAAGSTEKTPYVCIQPLGKHGEGPGSENVWMVYSDEKPDPFVLFTNVSAFESHHWPYTFSGLRPVTEPLAQLQPVVLHPAGLINANALESIASAMEISVMGARNAARIVAQLVEERRGRSEIAI